ncbi:hypothetical protein M409DRAFT_55630 [Zasmidium cellare ATCC 36951]|uniref:Uncharacterized protein n=1 Tax=Zasmidium cellare ATCC 36951 TaxID=1080233 RepID=A0A6A6CK03_ZASCE|nr:uncharacterized protein M409DRAFT_55630 [Zasmidium cellare ATCC 36951]KAF2165756.1 hypothetical protein M409DRAFT_55630 [Zasmidium cellare ATCC 36951]
MDFVHPLAAPRQRRHESRLPDHFTVIIPKSTSAACVTEMKMQDKRGVLPTLCLSKAYRNSPHIARSAERRHPVDQPHYSQNRCVNDHLVQLISQAFLGFVLFAISPL